MILFFFRTIRKKSYFSFSLSPMIYSGRGGGSVELIGYSEENVRKILNVGWSYFHTCYSSKLPLSKWRKIVFNIQDFSFQMGTIFSSKFSLCPWDMRLCWRRTIEIIFKHENVLRCKSYLKIAMARFLLPSCVDLREDHYEAITNPLW